MALNRMSDLVSSAGEALGLTADPLYTTLAAKLEEATNAELITENWDANMAICDLVNSSPAGPTQLVRAVRRRLDTAGLPRKSVQLVLTVLQTCVKNCNHALLVVVCQQEFCEFLLSRVLSPQLDCGTDCQAMLLSLIQSWAHAFSPDPLLCGVAEVYMDLKKKGVMFPDPTDEDLLLVQSMQLDSSPQPVCSSPTESVESIPAAPAATRSVSSGQQRRLTAGQVDKLGRDLDIASRNLAVLTELLGEVRPGQQESEDGQLLEQVAATCLQMHSRVQELVPLVQHRELTGRLLELNDGLQTELERYRRYQAKCQLGVAVRDHDAFSPDEVLLTVPAGTVEGSRPVSQVSSGLKSDKETDLEVSWTMQTLNLNNCF